MNEEEETEVENESDEAKRKEKMIMDFLENGANENSVDPLEHLQKKLIVVENR